MNTGKNYNDIVYGSGFKKIKAKISVLLNWLNHPKMKEAANKSGKSLMYLRLDFIKSIIIYGATLQDYLLFEFYNKKHNKRKTYVTGRKLHRLFDSVNNKEKTMIFKDKNQFADVFSRYLGRDLFKLDLERKNIKEAKEWLNNYNVIFAKPSDGVQGRGVTRLVIENVEETIDFCIKNKLDILEEPLKQHSKMNELYPKSINTVRFITLVQKGQVELLGASLRMGNGGVVDNGGVYVSVDMTNGKIDSIAHTNEGTIFKEHPITGHPMKGFQIPSWPEVIKICKEAALEVPDNRCVGWDVAITESGPVIIEGNDRWSRFLWQLPKQKGLNYLIKNH